jgi:hypothetical protein
VISGRGLLIVVLVLVIVMVLMIVLMIVIVMVLVVFSLRMMVVMMVMVLFRGLGGGDLVGRAGIFIDPRVQDAGAVRGQFVDTSVGAEVFLRQGPFGKAIATAQWRDRHQRRVIALAGRGRFQPDNRGRAVGFEGRLRVLVEKGTEIRVQQDVIQKLPIGV